MVDSDDGLSIQVDVLRRIAELYWADSRLGIVSSGSGPCGWVPRCQVAC